MIVAPHGTVEKTPCGLFSPLTSIHTDLSLLTPAIKVRRQDSERERAEMPVTTCSPGAWGLSHQVTGTLPSHSWFLSFRLLEREEKKN